MSDYEVTQLLDTPHNFEKVMRVCIMDLSSKVREVPYNFLHF